MDHIETPLIQSLPLSQMTGKEIYLKLENLQPTGSFKNRGMGHLCERLAQEGAKGFVIFSGGNAGLAVAYAGRRLGLPVKVVMSKQVLPFMKEKIEKEGAEGIIYGEGWVEAAVKAKELAKEFGYALLSPFDHPYVWEGNATLVDEVVKEGIKPDVIIVAVGGGGLLCGILQGLHKAGWGDIPVITAETVGAASFAKSVKAGHPITLEKMDSIATSIGAIRICDEAWEWTKKHPIYPCVVTDEEALTACRIFLKEHRMLVEPACGAALAALNLKEMIAPYKKILVIVCGGIVVDLKAL